MYSEDQRQELIIQQNETNTFMKPHNHAEDEGQMQIVTGVDLSNTSIDSIALEEQENKKKLLQGFNEMKDIDEMICKRLKKEINLGHQDDYENITDLTAYTAMIPIHKVSKFGNSYHKQRSSKLVMIKNDEFDEDEFVNESIELEDGRLAYISFYPIQIRGKALERPEVEIKTYNLQLKAMSKLVFLTREKIENIIIQNLSFNGKEKHFNLDMAELLQMTRDNDITHSKRKHHEIKARLVIPEIMFDEEFNQEEYKETSIPLPQNKITIDVSIVMPHLVLAVEQDDIMQTYIKQLNSEDMIVLIKDKFINWKDLAQDIMEKKLKYKQFTPLRNTQNTYYIHSSDYNLEKLETTEHVCEDDWIRRDTTKHCLTSKIYLNPYEYVFLQYENFKFGLRWDFDDPALVTYYCNLNDPNSSPEIMALLKSQKVDILKSFAEDCQILWHDPSNTWRINCDFSKVAKSLKYNEERYLSDGNRTCQRTFIRVKILKNWLVLDMNQPQIHVQTHFKDASSYDEARFKDQNQTVKLNTKALVELVQSQFNNWEVQMLDFMKINHSQIKLV